MRERPQLNKHFPTALQSNSSSSNLNSSLNDSLKEDDSINMSNITALPESEVRKKISEGNKKFLKDNLDSLERVKDQCKKMQENKNKNEE